MAYQYIISKRLDPIFAVSVGLAAAAARISREEAEKGRTGSQSIEVLKRRFGIWWQGEGGEKKP